MADAGIPLEVAKNADMSRGKGCNYCQKKGYRGRMGIYELMTVTAKIREMIFAGVSTAEVRKVAITEGMDTLYVDGIRKVLNGVTTLDEVYRVAKKTEQDVVTGDQ